MLERRDMLHKTIDEKLAAEAQKLVDKKKVTSLNLVLRYNLFILF